MKLPAATELLLFFLTSETRAFFLFPSATDLFTVAVRGESGGGAGSSE